MSYRIAGIDVHKKMLAVVVSDVEVDGEYRFERRMFGSNPEQLRALATWLLEQEAEAFAQKNYSIHFDTRIREEQDHVEVSPFEARLPLPSPNAVSIKATHRIEQ
jgi:hypothetical protein